MIWHDHGIIHWKNGEQRGDNLWNHADVLDWLRGSQFLPNLIKAITSLILFCLSSRVSFISVILRSGCFPISSWALTWIYSASSGSTSSSLFDRKPILCLSASSYINFPYNIKKHDHFSLRWRELQPIWRIQCYGRRGALMGPREPTRFCSH